MKAALFDMGDTLITGFGDGETSDVCRQLAREQPKYRDLLNKTAELFEQERERYLRTCQQRSFDEVYFELCRHLFPESEVPHLKKLLDVVFRRLTMNATLYTDTLEVLESLHGRVKLGIVSNVGFLAWRYQQLLIRKQVFWYFDTAVFSSTFRVRKPDPSIFRNALVRLSVEPGEAIHVGDKLGRDVSGAHAAGIRAVWLNRTEEKLRRKKDRPEWVAKDLTEVLRTIDGLLDTYA